LSLAQRRDRRGITVNTVSPGIVVTPGVEEFDPLEAARPGWGQDWPAIEAGVLADILDNPTGRLGRPAEVADLVAFVASRWPPTSTAPTCASTAAASPSCDSWDMTIRGKGQEISKPCATHCWATQGCGSVSSRLAP
jgi:NAD(P)-dependent dehydrogenase (short-subunit alcohol dehydrogenase family)